ncbi:MAG: hypothetical protein R2707_16285 [Acidimicrobiales bacterium]
MTAVDDNSLDAGEWGAFVARAVQDIRRELGEAAANRVATSLRSQRADAMDAANEELRATRAMLEAAKEEVAEAQRAHGRLQADLARMHTAVREAKDEALRIRSDAADHLAQRRAEVDAAAEAESRRIAAAWEELRAEEAAVAARRSELLGLDELAGRRLAEVAAAEAELDELRRSIESERVEAQRLVEEAIAKLDEVETESDSDTAAGDHTESVDDVVDLRDTIDLRAAALDEREAELVEWEAELVAKTQGLERRIATAAPRLPGDNPAGWGRRPRLTR